MQESKKDVAVTCSRCVTFSNANMIFRQEKTRLQLNMTLVRKNEEKKKKKTFSVRVWLSSSPFMRMIKRQLCDIY